MLSLLRYCLFNFYNFFSPTPNQQLHSKTFQHAHSVEHFLSFDHSLARLLEFLLACLLACFTWGLFHIKYHVVCAVALAYPENGKKWGTKRRMKGMEWNYIRYRKSKLRRIFFFLRSCTNNKDELAQARKGDVCNRLSEGEKNNSSESLHNFVMIGVLVVGSSWKYFRNLSYSLFFLTKFSSTRGVTFHQTFIVILSEHLMKIRMGNKRS